MLKKRLPDYIREPWVGFEVEWVSAVSVLVFQKLRRIALERAIPRTQALRVLIELRIFVYLSVFDFVCE